MPLEMAEKTFPERFRVRVFQVVEWVLQHRSLLAAALAGVVLALAGGGVWWWQAERREGIAGMALMAVNQVFRQQYPAGFFLPTGEGDDPKPDPLIQRYHQLADEFAGTRAGTEAILRAGHLEYSAGRYDAAMADYDRYGRVRRAPFRASAMLGKGYALEAKGDVPGAVAAFGLAAETAGRDPLAAEAYLAQGRTLEALKKRDEALRVYALVVERFPQSSWAVRATERMSALR